MKWMMNLMTALMMFMFAGAAQADAPSRDVQTTTFVDQQDANSRCPSVCSNAGYAQWNGQWTNTPPSGKSPVCGCVGMNTPVSVIITRGLNSPYLWMFNETSDNANGPCFKLNDSSPLDTYTFTLENTYWTYNSAMLYLYYSPEYNANDFTRYDNTYYKKNAQGIIDTTKIFKNLNDVYYQAFTIGQVFPGKPFTTQLPNGTNLNLKPEFKDNKNLVITIGEPTTDVRNSIVGIVLSAEYTDGTLIDSPDPQIVMGSKTGVAPQPPTK